MDAGYRLSAAVLLISSVCVSAYYYRRAGRTRPVIYDAQEGHALATLRILWISAAMGGVVVYVVYPPRVALGQLPLPDAVRLLGIIPAIGHVALLTWAHRALGDNFSTSLHIGREHQLVTSGPYRWIRHPLYVAGLLAFVAWGLLSANALIGALGIGFGLFIMFVRTPREERMLEDTFGATYRDYMARTGRFLPRLPRS